MATRPRYVSGPKRGDSSRDALLAALDELLAGAPLAEIGIADITRAAGLTRSGFYFYFPSKAAAVAALLADFYEEMIDAAEDWYGGGPGSPEESLRVGFEASVALWRERATLMVAMLDAIGTDADVRAIWDAWVDGFVERVAARITAERHGGEVGDGALATVLVGAAFAAMERDVRAIRAGRVPSDQLIAALVDVWNRALYG